LNPAGSFTSRNWPLENYVELIKTLNHRYPDYHIVIIGNKAELIYVDRIYKVFKEYGNISSLAGKTTFNELISIINNARFMITNDTGPLHIAYAVDTPVIGLFGPCSPIQYGMSNRSISIYNKMYCSPCVHEFEKPPCNGNNQCLMSIKQQQVLVAIEDLLNGNFQHLTDTMIYTSDKNDALGIVHRS